MKLVIWDANPAGGYCTLEELEKVDDAFELKRGISRAKGFPKEACFRMDKGHPKEMKLPDNIWNGDGMVVISKKLKEFVDSKKPPATEFLPVTIYDHKRRVASNEYFIVNPIRMQDCIDQRNSQLMWNKIDPELICGCTKLALSNEELDENLLLFRPRHLPMRVFIREDLAEAIKKEGFTGIHFIDPDKFLL